MDQRIIDLYDQYTHAPLPRRDFLDRLARLAGGSAAALALLPLLENNYARAAQVEETDGRITVSTGSFAGATGPVRYYEAVPKAAPQGTVIVIHENRGLNAHIQDVARRFAVDGFRAVAPDFLSPAGGTPADEDKARELIGGLDAAATLADAVQAVQFAATGGTKVAAVGFCWGGGLSGRLATAESALSAAVVYYGMPPASEAVAAIKVPLLLHYAGQDERINAAVPAFEAALKAAQVRYDLHTYEGVQHAFNNDANTARYNEAAAAQAWGRTISFLRQTLA
ncbi:dienelactone hydrolase family protein [Zavarzinia compransoris]|uniref:Carboxymethylenebutenolidase n=1 Tax=Zavarzinia compransoris TaxID=1264899 RepID=A0A317E9S8_9PROT|nr:dienelactone hydrolase family protein [Zavarzinia compransoris]PWR23679.1 carboxymethylenebutenolidase [Zavarzinia compransoris]TDP47898.1 carboxymethylenebutenolidase [Zavarzinia compransoris]